MESRLVIVRGWGNSGKWGVSADGCGVSFWGSERVLKLVMVMVHNSVNVLKITEFYIANGWIVWYVNYISVKLLEKTNLPN